MVATVSLLTPSRGPLAQDSDLGWKNTTEFSFVSTSGNSDIETLGLNNKLIRDWENAQFLLDLRAIRSEAIVDKFAVGTTSSFRVVEVSETTAESYYINGKYSRNISDSFYWFGSTGWTRNEFSGIESRTYVAGGVGNIWKDEETRKFRTDYSVTYTNEENVVADPDTDDSFLGLRGTLSYLNKFGKSTTYTSDLIFDENLYETSDWRVDWTNSAAVTMSEMLALPVSLRLLYDNEPALEELDLFDSSGSSKNMIGTVTEELDELDIIFTASLVVRID